MITPVFCTQCGAALAPDTAFCEQCGKRIETVAPVAPLPFSSDPPAAETPLAIPRSGSLRLARLILLLVAALTGGLLYYLFANHKPARTVGTQDAPPSPSKEIPPGQMPPSTPTQAKPVRISSPVEVAYIHFLDEAGRMAKGSIEVGSPTRTATRIEVNVTAEGARHTVVVLEKSNDGTTAVVVVGPKDAGAIRSYTLQRRPEGWAIGAIEDLDG